MDRHFYVSRTRRQWDALPKTFGASSVALLWFQQRRAASAFERNWEKGLRRTVPGTAWTGSGKLWIGR